MSTHHSASEKIERKLCGSFSSPKWNESYRESATLLKTRQVANWIRVDLIIGRGGNPLFKIYDLPNGFVHTGGEATTRPRRALADSFRALAKTRPIRSIWHDSINYFSAHPHSTFVYNCQVRPSAPGRSLGGRAVPNYRAGESEPNIRRPNKRHCAINNNQTGRS